MTLLREVLNSPIDPGYSVAAGRKKRLNAAGLTERPSPVAKALILGLAIILGFVTISAVLSMRSRADLSSTTRQVLIKEIRERQERYDLLSDQRFEVLATVDALHAEVLETADPQLSQAMARDELNNGAIAVTGPGLRITLKDGPGSDEDQERRVQDTDVRTVVNGLWSAGAESISINSKRLTATSAIRSAGSAILVDLTGLSQPYVIEAIGNPEQLEARFIRSNAGDQLALLASAFGIDSQISQEQNLEMSSGSPRSLRVSKPIEMP